MHSTVNVATVSSDQYRRDPFGTDRSGVKCTTLRSASGKPSVSNSDTNGPMRRGGRLTTHPTCHPQVLVRNLRAGSLDSEFEAEIEGQLPRRLDRIDAAGPMAAMLLSPKVGHSGLD